MTLVILLSLLVCIVGGLVYLLARPPGSRVGELGRLAFLAGLIVTLLELPNHIVRL